MQGGFANNSRYTYENVIEAWMKPVDMLLVGEAGYPNYGIMATVREETITEEADCLSELVPLMQQSTVDYLADPVEINALITELTIAFNSPDPLGAEATADSTSIMVELNIVGNGSNATIGDFDLDRAQSMVDLTLPIFLDSGADTANPAITAEDLVTNQFIDPNIGL